jgi:RNA polymerase sigma-70 factor (ECF subfamily)
MKAYADVQVLPPHASMESAAIRAAGSFEQCLKAALASALFEETPAPTDAEQERAIARNVFRNPDAFEKLFTIYYDRIRNYLYRQTADLDLAEDLTSQTFLSAFDYLRNSEREMVSVRAWMYCIARNKHLTHVRGGKRKVTFLARLKQEREGATAAAADAAICAEGEAAEIRRAIAKLPDKPREALLLRYDEELSYEEIAAILNIAEEAARARVSRGVKALRKQFASLSGEGEAR